MVLGAAETMPLAVVPARAIWGYRFHYCCQAVVGTPAKKSKVRSNAGVAQLSGRFVETTDSFYRRGHLVATAPGALSGTLAARCAADFGDVDALQ